VQKRKNDIDRNINTIVSRAIEYNIVYVELYIKGIMNTTMDIYAKEDKIL
jgi:hypothetical protein